MSRIGDGPIEPAYFEQMNSLARGIDTILNEDTSGTERKIGFVLLVFPFNSTDGRCNFISNGADRKDIVVMFKEMIARFEGQAEQKGRA